MGTRNYLAARALVTFGLVFGAGLALAGCGADSPAAEETAKAAASSGDAASTEPGPQSRSNQKN